MSSTISISKIKLSSIKDLRGASPYLYCECRLLIIYTNEDSSNNELILVCIKFKCCSIFWVRLSSAHMRLLILSQEVDKLCTSSIIPDEIWSLHITCEDFQHLQGIKVLVSKHQREGQSAERNRNAFVQASMSQCMGAICKYVYMY